MPYKHYAYDTETTIKNDNPSVFAGNRIVVEGVYSKEGFELSKPPIGDNIIISAHNAKFDLHHWMNEEPDVLSRIATSDCFVWDTQLAEYLLTAQQTQMSSLNQLAEEYLGEKKVDGISEFFNQGIGADEIDRDLLVEYLEQDVALTHKIAVLQMNKAKNALPLFKTQMDALLATTEMEYNGMYVDLDRLEELEEEYAAEVAEAASKFTYLAGNIIEPLNDQIREANEDPDYDVTKKLIDIGVTKDRLLSFILFGGTMKTEVKKATGEYTKKGKPKYKLGEYAVTYNGLAPKLKKFTKETAHEGVYSVSAKVIQKIAANAEGQARDIIEAVLAHRDAYKLLNTFVNGIKNNLAVSGTPYIHHRLHHTTTDTGRLSSSDPNLQNMPGKEDVKLKEVFTSRWGDDGVVAEADFKQLEVIALAYLSKDPTLVADLKAGRDMHYETGKKVMGWTSPDQMNKDDRRVVKMINFLLIYGGGAATAAAQTGVTVDLAQSCITAFYERYPGVKAWHESLTRKYDVECQPFHKEGVLLHRWTPSSPTGRKYTFTSFMLDGARGPFEATPFNEIVNYPVQGLATGDIVPLVMGKLLRRLKKDDRLRDRCLMINTVHDSIIFDIHKDVLDYALAIVKEEMEKAPKYLEEFGITDFDLPLIAELSYGPNWKQQEEIEL